MKSFFIFGSCVSRDSVEKIINKISLIDYYARSSLCSLSTGSFDLNILPIENISSPFQRKMVLRDCNKAFFNEERFDEIDYIVIDFVDERFPLISDSQGCSATLSAELNSALGNDVNNFTYVDPFSEKYFQGFEKGFTSFIEHLGVNKEKLILIEAYWCFIDNEGIPLSKYDRSYIEKNNSKLEKLYELAKNAFPEMKVITIPSELLKADKFHKWGVAPFHYISEFYDYVIDQIKPF